MDANIFDVYFGGQDRLPANAIIKATMKEFKGAGAGETEKIMEKIGADEGLKGRNNGVAAESNM